MLACIKSCPTCHAPFRKTFSLLPNRTRIIQLSSKEPTDGDAVTSNKLRKGFQPQRRYSQQPPKQTAESKPLSAEQEWRSLDKKFNKYPGPRTFTAIGSGGEEFRAAMVSVVEAVVGEVRRECVVERPSSKGQYVSVKIGPVLVKNPDQVLRVYEGFKADKRVKWTM